MIINGVDRNAIAAIITEAHKIVVGNTYRIGRLKTGHVMSFRYTFKTPNNNRFYVTLHPDAIDVGSGTIPGTVVHALFDARDASTVYVMGSTDNDYAYDLNGARIPN